jgi:hypothetical protein
VAGTVIVGAAGAEEFLIHERLAGAEVFADESDCTTVSA